MDTENLIASVIDELYLILNKYNIKVKITGRYKTPYSIWQKIQNKNISIDQITDIVALRIIVNKIIECYQILGILHYHYKIDYKSFKDFIRSPKKNGYQSLHLVLHKNTSIKINKIEIQIRTQKMDEIAELGLAAHWKYKQKLTSDDEYYKYINELIINLKESNNIKNFLQHSKIEIYYDRVFCFTPKGKLISLPKGAIVLDFAYAIHSDIGNHYAYAKINKEIVKKNTVLKNGDTIRIIISSNITVLDSWLKFVITKKAKLEIYKILKKIKNN